MKRYKAPKGKFVVPLAAESNPDFWPDSWEANVVIKERPKVVGSLAEASKVCRQFIGENDLGGGNWTGGDVFDDQGQNVARVSYNGRVWDAKTNAEIRVAKALLKLARRVLVSAGAGFTRFQLD